MSISLHVTCQGHALEYLHPVCVQIRVPEMLQHVALQITFN